jgi:hypothetical protein
MTEIPGLDVVDLTDLCEHFEILAELYGFYHERETPRLAFKDGLITAEELAYLLDD